MKETEKIDIDRSKEDALNSAAKYVANLLQVYLLLFFNKVLVKDIEALGSSTSVCCFFVLVVSPSQAFNVCVRFGLKMKGSGCLFCLATIPIPAPN